MGAVNIAAAKFHCMYLNFNLGKHKSNKVATKKPGGSRSNTLHEEKAVEDTVNHAAPSNAAFLKRINIFIYYENE